MNFARKFQNSQIVLQSARIVKFVVDGHGDVEVLRTRPVEIGTEVVLADADQDPWDDNEWKMSWLASEKWFISLQFTAPIETMGCSDHMLIGNQDTAALVWNTARSSRSVAQKDQPGPTSFFRK